MNLNEFQRHTERQNRCRARLENSPNKGEYLYHKTVSSPGIQKITITCRDHGDFERGFHSHLNGAGCPRCKKHGKPDADYRYFYFAYGRGYCGSGFTDSIQRTLIEHSTLLGILQLEVVKVPATIAPLLDVIIYAELSKNEWNPHNYALPHKPGELQVLIEFVRQFEIK